MSRLAENHVRAKATEFLRDLWRRRRAIWHPSPVSPDDIFPLDVRAVAEKGLRIRFEDPESIPPTTPIPARLVPVQTAGFIDRTGGRIVVAQEFQSTYRRFTGAHEIGHWLLHPKLTYHRDRPLKGNERLIPQRPPEEYEADVFAAELLMPSKYLRNCFTARFRDAIRISSLDETTVFWLSGRRPSTGRIPDLASHGKRYLALQVATCRFFASQHFDSIADRFGVSPTAAAIRLEELRLVN